MLYMFGSELLMLSLLCADYVVSTGHLFLNAVDNLALAFPFSLSVTFIFEGMIHE